MMTMVTIEPSTYSSSIAVSHSFTGQHVQDGSDEEADAERQHRDIKHGNYLRNCSIFFGTQPIAPPQRNASERMTRRLPRVLLAFGRASRRRNRAGIDRSIK